MVRDKVLQFPVDLSNSSPPRLEWFTVARWSWESPASFPTARGRRWWTSHRSWDTQSEYFHNITNTRLTQTFRNKFFIKFPGRDLGGLLAFLKGFRSDAWVACLVYILLWPAVFSVTNLVLFYFNSGQTEAEHLNYGWNLLIFLAGVAQQVVTAGTLHFLRSNHK